MESASIAYKQETGHLAANPGHMNIRPGSRRGRSLHTLTAGMTETLKQLLERYLDIPSAAAGEGSHWSFQHRMPWPDGLPQWLVLLLAVALLAGVLHVSLRDSHALSLPRRVLLAGLRLGVLLLVLVMLMQWTLAVDRTGLPVVAVLIDTSATMAETDDYTDEQSRAAVQRAMNRHPGEDPTRLLLAKDILLRDNSRFLRQLAERHKLVLYRFDETAHPVGNRASWTVGEIDELAEPIGQLVASGTDTRPAPAVRHVLDDLRGSPPSAMVLLTDGITSTGEIDSLAVAAELAAAQRIPLFPIGIGSEEPLRDLQLYDVLAPEMAFVEDTLTFSAKLKAWGLSGQEVQVTLSNRATGEQLGSRTLRAGPDGQPVKIELSHTPREEGEFDFLLQVTEVPEEATTRNNSQIRTISVRREQVRVLLADAVPRYEFRYLKHLLERDETVELHTILQEADLEYAAEDATALDHFPVRRDELLQYDVLILGDLNPSYLSSAILESLRSFVADAGRGIIFVAGPRYSPQSYIGTPLEDLLPVELDHVGQPADDRPVTESFRPELTLRATRGTSIFRFEETLQDSQAVWGELPELLWFLEFPEHRTGATVLAEHPTRTGRNGKLPIILYQQYSGGRVLFHATDELWRWRFRRGDQYYRRYWIQAIRFLTRSRLPGGDRGAELYTDHTSGRYVQGETVYLKLRFAREKLAPVDDHGVQVIVEQQGGARRTMTLSRLPTAPGVFEGQITGLAAGEYHAWVLSPAAEGRPWAVDFHVEAPRRELAQRSLDRPALVQAATLTDGVFTPFPLAAGLPERIPPGQPVALETREPVVLWNRPELLLLFLGLLTTEWLLRKRWRLL